LAVGNRLKGRGYDYLIIREEIVKHLVGNYSWPKAIAVTGALGSGKTEWVLNLAFALKAMNVPITVADVDIINPYFCVRQIQKLLEDDGLTIISPPESAKWSDMPVLSPKVGWALKDPRGKLLLDIGGDAIGVRALKQFADLLEEVGYLLILIVNTFRPQTSDLEGISDMIRRMESISSLKIGAIVANCHLMEQTTLDELVEGIYKASNAAKELELPLLYATVPPNLHNEINRISSSVDVPLWPLERRMMLPWEENYNWTGR